MKYLDLTLGSPEENLACDEALLDWAEEGGPAELLRFWEPTRPFVVAGYANRLETEVHVQLCSQRGIPVLRRCTGGGTVVQGPGCLNYTLVLPVDETGPTATIPGTNRWIMNRLRDALVAGLGLDVQVHGHTDLTLDGRKFSGNSQRRKRRCLLFHGTLLLRFDLALIEELLPLPSKQPSYRAHRSHREFLRNLDLPAEALKGAFRRAWNAPEPAERWPAEATERLVQHKYSHREWNCRF